MAQLCNTQSFSSKRMPTTIPNQSREEKIAMAKQVLSQQSSPPPQSACPPPPSPSMLLVINYTGLWWNRYIQFSRLLLYRAAWQEDYIITCRIWRPFAVLWNSCHCRLFVDGAMMMLSFLKVRRTLSTAIYQLFVWRDLEF